MPGAKDCGSIEYKVHHQKRLFLCNLEELYTAFRQEHEEDWLGKILCLEAKMVCVC